MGKHTKRIRRMPRKGLDRMQARAERKMKGMTWRGWIDEDGEWMGSWRFTIVHKSSDRRALADYADHAPFRWKVLAVARCQRVDPHGKIEAYDDSSERTTGQRVLRDELVEFARETMAEATENTNPNHIVAHFYVLTPIV